MRSPQRMWGTTNLGSDGSEGTKWVDIRVEIGRQIETKAPADTVYCNSATNVCRRYFRWMFTYWALNRYVAKWCWCFNVSHWRYNSFLRSINAKSANCLGNLHLGWMVHRHVWTVWLNKCLLNILETMEFQNDMTPSCLSGRQTIRVWFRRKWML